jgi:hypothetical protein
MQPHTRMRTLGPVELARSSIVVTVESACSRPPSTRQSLVRIAVATNDRDETWRAALHGPVYFEYSVISCACRMFHGTGTSRPKATRPSPSHRRSFSRGNAAVVAIRSSDIAQTRSCGAFSGPPSSSRQNVHCDFGFASSRPGSCANLSRSLVALSRACDASGCAPPMRGFNAGGQRDAKEHRGPFCH